MWKQQQRQLRICRRNHRPNVWTALQNQFCSAASGGLLPVTLWGTPAEDGVSSPTTAPVTLWRTPAEDRVSPPNYCSCHTQEDTCWRWAVSPDCCLPSCHEQRHADLSVSSKPGSREEGIMSCALERVLLPQGRCCGLRWSLSDMLVCTSCPKRKWRGPLHCRAAGRWKQALTNNHNLLCSCQYAIIGTWKVYFSGHFIVIFLQE